jgi:hypothetical protein
MSDELQFVVGATGCTMDHQGLGIARDKLKFVGRPVGAV